MGMVPRWRSAPIRVGVAGFRVERVSPCFVYLQERGAVDVDRGEWRRFRGDRGEGTSCFFVEEQLSDLLIIFFFVPVAICEV